MCCRGFAGVNVRILFLGLLCGATASCVAAPGPHGDVDSKDDSFGEESLTDSGFEEHATYLGQKCDFDRIHDEEVDCAREVRDYDFDFDYVDDLGRGRLTQLSLFRDPDGPSIESEIGAEIFFEGDLIGYAVRVYDDRRERYGTLFVRQDLKQEVSSYLGTASDRLDDHQVEREDEEIGWDEERERPASDSTDETGSDEDPAPDPPTDCESGSTVPDDEFEGHAVQMGQLCDFDRIDSNRVTCESRADEYRFEFDSVDRLADGRFLEAFNDRSNATLLSQQGAAIYLDCQLIGYAVRVRDIHPVTGREIDGTEFMHADLDQTVGWFL